MQVGIFFGQDTLKRVVQEAEDRCRVVDSAKRVNQCLEFIPDQSLAHRTGKTGADTDEMLLMIYFVRGGLELDFSTKHAWRLKKYKFGYHLYQNKAVSV